MSAETLRQAAALMRERAEAATPGPWSNGGRYFWKISSGRGLPDGWWWAVQSDDGDLCQLAEGDADDAPRDTRADAEHIASWHPGVALAVAKLLDDQAALIEGFGDFSDIEEMGDANALGVALAFLAENESFRPDRSDSER